MNMKQKIKVLEEYYNSLPDWYWKHGLHDAEILSIEVELDYQRNEVKKERYKSIEIFLDSKGAIFETDIQSIILNDCIICASDIPILMFNEYLKEKKMWWMGDTVEKKNWGYKLDIEFSDEWEKRIFLSLRISEAKIIRKK